MHAVWGKISCKVMKIVVSVRSPPPPPPPQRDLYLEGHRLYYAEDWQSMVDTFEKSLLEFYKELDDCRVMCAGPLKYGSTRGFAQVWHVVT